MVATAQAASDEAEGDRGGANPARDKRRKERQRIKPGGRNSSGHGDGQRDRWPDQDIGGVAATRPRSLHLPL
jgi:hypothetical protein